MANRTVVGQLTYFKDNHDDSAAEYSDRDGMVEIMKDAGEAFIEMALEPDAQAKTVDRLYIKIPVNALLIAIADVLAQKEDEF